MPQWWEGAMEKVWKEPSEEMVQLTLEELDPASSPGIDGVPAALYQKLEEVFVPQI